MHTVPMELISVHHVVESLRRLRHLGIHRLIVMYLCIKRTAAQQKTLENLEVDFREFFDRFLTVRDAPTDRVNKPYIIPFEASDAKIWMNRNLAGSFAPSSIRPDNPINTIIAMNGKGAGVRYTLKPNHSRFVFSNLLNEKKIPVLDLAVFLYRDFGFNSDQMDAQILLTVFADEFGYLEDGEFTADFNEVFLYNPELAPEDLSTTFVQL